MGVQGRLGTGSFMSGNGNRSGSQSPSSASSVASVGPRRWVREAFQRLYRQCQRHGRWCPARGPSALRGKPWAHGRRTSGSSSAHQVVFHEAGGQLADLVLRVQGPVALNAGL
jgi:hypothetical protein